MLKNILKIEIIFLLSVSLQAKLLQVVSTCRHGARYHLNDYYDGNSTKDLWG